MEILIIIGKPSNYHKIPFTKVYYGIELIKGTILVGNVMRLCVCRDIWLELVKQIIKYNKLLTSRLEGNLVKN